MMIEHKPTPKAPERIKPTTDLEYLEEANQSLFEIEKLLRSIKSSMTFFVVLAVLAIVIQGCTVLMGR